MLLYVLKTLSSWYEQKNDYDKCIQYTKRYVTMDAYAEEQYRRLMIFYARVGNKSMVVKTYNNCREKIREGYDSDVSQETKSLYEELISPAT